MCYGNTIETDHGYNRRINTYIKFMIRQEHLGVYIIICYIANKPIIIILLNYRYFALSVIIIIYVFAFIVIRSIRYYDNTFIIFYRIGVPTSFWNLVRILFNIVYDRTVILCNTRGCQNVNVIILPVPIIVMCVCVCG